MVRAAVPRRSGPKSAPRRPGELSLQAQKSAATRKQLLDAAVRCIIKHGYAGTTTLRVAAEAGLSRGAMLHHFENGPALIRAAIGHLHEKRLRAFRRAVTTLPEGDHLSASLKGYWAQVTHPLYVAFHELTIAARTDAELAAILKPAQAEFTARWRDLAFDVFPEWRADRRNFLLALALVQNTLDGMALNRMSGALDPQTEDILLDHLERQLRALRPAALPAAVPTEQAA